MPSDLTTEQRLALLDELESKEAARVRRAGLSAWASVLLAAAVMIAMLGVTGSKLSTLRREMRTTEDTLAKLRDTEATLTRNLAAKQAEMQATEAKLATVSSALGSVDATQSRRAVETAVNRDPKAAQLLPRIYLQIVDANDRAWAMDMGKRLQDAGFLVLGVEYVKDARPVPETEVRFYKKADEAVARRIADVLRQAGVTVRPPLHIQKLEDDPKFRPNQFEVWFARRPV